MLFPLSSRRLREMLALVAAFIALVGTGCGTGTPSGAVVGRASHYDYSPSVIQTGNVQQFWWCGDAPNPNKPSQASDTIQYSSIDLTTHVTVGPLTVLGETPGAWDAVFVCNPKVIRGAFNNPLGDGQAYSYAMYYVATASGLGIVNSIGVAFSNDGIKWDKYPDPVIPSSSQTDYGVGQPAVYNSDGRSGIWLFYEDVDAPPGSQHFQTKSTDGIHFTVEGKLTTNGLPPHTSWGDMAYDLVTGYWYAIYNLGIRDASTLGRFSERGELGVALYRIPNTSLLTGAVPWQQLKSFDTNLTGFESNFLAGFLRDPYGNVNIGPYPTIQIFTSISNPRPAWNASFSARGESASTARWDIGTVKWVPGNPLLPFNRYVNNSTHEVTTGWIDPAANFNLESTLGQLYESPQQGATVPFYGCKAASKDYFVSTDSACEGKFFLGTNGYGYSDPAGHPGLVALYSCYTGHNHFVSKDVKCEGHHAGTLLGYVVH